MAKDNQKNAHGPGPKPVAVHDILKHMSTGGENVSIMDEADGAMFSRIPSNLDRVVCNQDPRIVEDVASPFDDVIMPVSYRPIKAVPSQKLQNGVKDETLHRDEIDTGETISALNDSIDSIDNDKDKQVLLTSGKTPGTCYTDHSSFSRKKLSLKDSPNNSEVNNSEYICDDVNVQNITVDLNVNGTAETTRTPLKVADQQDTDTSPFQAKHLISLLFPFGSVIVFLADIGTDIELAVSYKRKGDLDLFYATLACIVIPSIIIAAVDLSWMRIDRKTVTGSSLTSKYLLVWRILVGVLSFGRIVRAFSHVYHIVHKKTGPNKKKHKQMALEQKRDCYMLDFINAFTESCPQLFVQIYLLYKYDLPLEFIRVVSLLTSWISIAWTYAAYYWCSREAIVGKQDVNFFGFLLFFMSVLAGLAPRVICVVLFLVYFNPWIGALLMLMHYFIMLVWIVLQKFKLEGTATTYHGRLMYGLLFAFVYMICFMNLKDTRARFRISIFYLIIYVENSVLAALVIWRMFDNDRYTNKPLNFIALPIGFIIHVTLLPLYYKCFHPKTCPKKGGTA